MSKIIIPGNFLAQQILLSAIRTKNVADGENSPLNLFLNNKNIDLDAAVAAGKMAADYESQRDELAIKSQSCISTRDRGFNPVFGHIKDSAQFLKVLYDDNYSQLMAWGIPITARGRINYPAAFLKRTQIAETFIEKHGSYPPGESPLGIFLNENGIDLAADMQATTKAVEDDTNATALAGQAALFTAKRNKIWAPVVANIRAIGGFLKKMNVTNIYALCYWGFKVQEGHTKPKLRKSKVKAGEKKTTMGITIGSILTNTGSTDIIVYKGKKVTGAGTTLKAGEQLGMVKGYSVITVMNLSTLKIARFTVEVNQ